MLVKVSHQHGGAAGIVLMEAVLTANVRALRKEKEQGGSGSREGIIQRRIGAGQGGKALRQKRPGRRFQHILQVGPLPHEITPVFQKPQREAPSGEAAVQRAVDAGKDVFVRRSQHDRYLVVRGPGLEACEENAAALTAAQKSSFGEKGNGLPHRLPAHAVVLTELLFSGKMQCAPVQAAFDFPFQLL